MTRHAGRPAGRIVVGPCFSRTARSMGKLGRAWRSFPRCHCRLTRTHRPSSVAGSEEVASCMDLYAWATYKTYSVNRSGKTGQPVPWRSLQRQLGCDYANPRHFKAAAKIAVRKVQAVFPGFRVEKYEDGNGGGLCVKKGVPAVGRRSEPSALLTNQ